MFVLVQKLKSLKQALKSWNKDIFGDMHKKVDMALKEVDHIQTRLMEDGWSDSLDAQEKNAQVDIQQALLYEEEFWREKSRLNWHSSGDRNTAYFHKVTRIRQASKQMNMLRQGDLILDNSTDIENHVVDYYSALLASSNTSVQNDLIKKSIPLLVSDMDNAMLTNLPTLEEVWSTVFSLNGQGAPGPDGFGGCFFQTYWDIVGPNVFAAVTQFFVHSWLLPNFNSNIVALIPKFPGADQIDCYRPIALTNFKFKVITKILADRLAVIAPKIISVNQRGFIKGRHISDCMCITSEAINLPDKKSFGGNIALKIDIHKAFDTIDWGFLLEVLCAFGFNSTFCQWINIILHSARLSFSVNGNAVGHFACKRGVRQGDPLSPLLFCIAEDVLSRAITCLAQNNQLSCMSGPQGCQTPTHVFYADDIMIFCRSSKQNLLNLMNLFRAYGEASGQLISADKCRFYTGTSQSRRLGLLADILGFHSGQLPFTYLGVPIFRGRPRKSHLQPIADRIKAKLASWKGSLLSIMGRVQLVKSIIHGMLIYSFHI